MSSSNVESNTTSLRTTFPSSVLDTYSSFQYLGSGVFGVTHRAIHKDTGATVSLKEIDVHFCTQQRIDMLKSELTELEELSKQAPSLKTIRRIDYSPDMQAFYLEMPYCDSTLATQLTTYRKRGISFSREEVWKALQDICTGLVFLHSTPKKAACTDSKQKSGSPSSQVPRQAQAPKVHIHGDLKLENIGFSANSVVLMDYGMNSFIDQTKDQRNTMSSSVFLAPEASAGRAMDPKSDMWSLGMVALTMLKGRLESCARNSASLNGYLSSIARENSDEDLQMFISRCLDINPVTRISSIDALEYITGVLKRDFLSVPEAPTLISSINADMDDGIHEHIDDLLLERDSRGHSALDLAVQKGNMEYIEILVTYLEKTSACLLLGPRPHIKRVSKYTNLMKLALLNRPEYIDEYLDREANCIYGLHGMTALMIAASHGHADCVRKLIKEAGVITVKGWTALMYAVRDNHPECVSLLRLEMGVTTPSFMRACDLAEHLGHKECLEFLKREKALHVGENCRSYSISWYNELLGNAVLAAKP